MGLARRILLMGEMILVVAVVITVGRVERVRDVRARVRMVVVVEAGRRDIRGKREGKAEK